MGEIKWEVKIKSKDSRGLGHVEKSALVVELSVLGLDTNALRLPRR